MTNSNQFVVLALDEQRYALCLSVVERIVRRVEIVTLPKAPAIILGVINVRGQIIPVVHLRARFGLPEREANLSDQLVIARTAKHTVALIVDAVMGVMERVPAEVTATEQILPRLEYVAGVVKMEDGLAFIHDLDAFLSLDEEQALDAALQLSE